MCNVSRPVSFAAARINRFAVYSVDIIITTAVPRQSERACRLLFTDNKPFRLLK